MYQTPLGTRKSAILIPYDVKIRHLWDCRFPKLPFWVGELLALNHLTTPLRWTFSKTKRNVSTDAGLTKSTFWVVQNSVPTCFKSDRKRSVSVTYRSSEKLERLFCWSTEVAVGFDLLRLLPLHEFRVNGKFKKRLGLGVQTLASN